MAIDSKLNDISPPKRESSRFVTPTTTLINDEEMPLEYKLLEERTGLQTSQIPQGIHQKLVRFGDEPKEKVKPGEKFDVLEYWKKNADYKDLIEIASVILANPASKHEITKDFAAFSLAASQLGDEISIENLNSFLLVSGNLEMLKDLNL